MADVKTLLNRWYADAKNQEELARILNSPVMALALEIEEARAKPRPRECSNISAQNDPAKAQFMIAQLHAIQSGMGMMIDDLWSLTRDRPMLAPNAPRQRDEEPLAHIDHTYFDQPKQQ